MLCFKVRFFTSNFLNFCWLRARAHTRTHIGFAFSTISQWVDSNINAYIFCVCVSLWRLSITQWVFEASSEKWSPAFVSVPSSKWSKKTEIKMNDELDAWSIDLKMIHLWWGTILNDYVRLRLEWYQICSSGFKYRKRTCVIAFFFFFFFTLVELPNGNNDIRNLLIVVLHRTYAVKWGAISRNATCTLINALHIFKIQHTPHTHSNSICAGNGFLCFFYVVHRNLIENDIPMSFRSKDANG